MNKLLTSWQDGIVPLMWDDFDFLQKAYKEAFSVIANVHDMGDCLLSGCSVTEQSLGASVTDGAIFLNGEVFIVKAMSAIKMNVDYVLYWEVSELYDSVGNRVDNNNNPIKPWLLRRAKIVYKPANAQGIKVSDVKRYKDLIRNYSLGKGEWVNLPLQNGWQNSTASLKVRRNAGFVEISGHVNGTHATGATLCILPVGFRPQHQTVGIFADSSSEALSALALWINQDGSVWAPVQQSGIINAVFSLD